MGTPSNKLDWFLADHQGSIHDVVDNAGTSVDHIVYDKLWQHGQPDEYDVRPAVRLHRPRAGDRGGRGQWYNRRRFYDAAVGRFVTQDPSGFNAGGVNLYRYVSNSPYIYTDPTGYVQESAAGADSLMLMRNPFAQDEYFFAEPPTHRQDLPSLQSIQDTAGRTAISAPAIKPGRSTRHHADSAVSSFTSDGAIWRLDPKNAWVSVMG